MSFPTPRKSGRLKTRKKSNHMSADFEYDENKFDPDDESNVEIQTKSIADISTNISDLLQSHSEEISDEIIQLDPTAFPNVLSKLQTQGEEIQGVGSLIDAQLLSCDVCGKMFSDVSSYDRHLKTHLSERQFHCGQCEKTFLDSCSLRRHMRAHENDRPFSCEICQKSFRDTASISRHMLTHTERPRSFQCSVCDKTFADKCGLKRHERTHTGVRPFVCEVCQKAFLDSCSFKRHQKIHIGIKNFHCSTCNRSFMEKQSLVRHQKTVCKLQDEMSDLKQDGTFDGNEASNQSSDSNTVDNQNNASQFFVVDEMSAEYPNHSTTNGYSLSTHATTPQTAVSSHPALSSNHLVTAGVMQPSKSSVKGQPSLGSLIQKDPGLYSSISEIVESIDSYEKMLDLCGDQGQKEIDAALTRDSVPNLNNLLCFECGELLVDGANFKSEGKLFHASLTNAFKCLRCEAAEEDAEDEYGEPPVLMPHYDVDAEDSLVQTDANAIEIENSLQLSEISKVEPENFYGTSEPMDQFQDRMKKEHGVYFLNDISNEGDNKLGKSDDCLPQLFANIDEQSNFNSIPVPLKSNSKRRKTRSKRNQSKKQNSTTSSFSVDAINTGEIEGLLEGEQPTLKYEADDSTIPSVFPCHLCTKVFASASFLAQHLYLHKNSPHKCMVCTKSFTSAPALKRHMRLHTGEKPYACPFCQKQFRDPSNFGKHKKNCVNMVKADPSPMPVLASDCLPSPNIDDSSFINSLNQSSFDESRGNHFVQGEKGGRVVQNRTGGFLDNGPSSDVVDENMPPECSNIDLMKIEEERYPVMAVMPFLDDEDGLDNQSVVDDENGLENNAQNVSTISNDKGKKDENGEKESRYVPCKVCQKLCENQDHLEMHMNYHTGNPNVTCIECGKTFADSFGMKRHMRTHLGVRPFTCEYCNRGYCDNWSLKKHKSKGCVKVEVKVPVDLLHPCPKCIKVFCDEEMLQGHMKIHKGLTPMKYECDVCHKRFSEAFNLKKHRRLHMAICPGCGQEFNNIQLLNSHQESECTASRPDKDDVIAPEDDKSFSCDICGRVYSTRAYLDRHRKIHSDIKPHVCEICNKRFSEAFKLRRHKKSSHSDEKPFICQDCGKCFSDNGALKRHAISSSCALSKVMGEPVNSETCACQFCDKVFQKNYMLVRHMTVHSQNRPFACELCGRSYKDTSSLKRHQMIHQGVKDFICSNCGADFYYSDSLKRHMSGRCGKKNKGRRRKTKAVSWTQPKNKKRYPKKSVSKVDDASHIIAQSNANGSSTNQRTELHTSPYVPTIIPDPSASFSVPLAQKHLMKEGKWSCHFNRHCWLCDTKAHSSSSLVAHRRRVHQSNEKRFSCPKCFFRLHKKLYWRAHALSCRPSHRVKPSGVDPGRSNNNVKATRKRTFASTTETAISGSIEGSEIVPGDVGGDGKRPRRSVPRAKWSWISQI